MLIDVFLIWFAIMELYLIDSFVGLKINCMYFLNGLIFPKVVNCVVGFTLPTIKILVLYILFWCFCRISWYKFFNYDTYCVSFSCFHSLFNNVHEYYNAVVYCTRSCNDFFYGLCQFLLVVLVIGLFL